MRPGCELVGCKPDNAFVPNAAGFSIYKRVDGVGSTAVKPAYPGVAVIAPGAAGQAGQAPAGLDSEVAQLKADVAALRAEVKGLRASVGR